MKYIFLAIICSIFNFLPFNMREHCYIWDKIFNTDIFRNELIYITPLLMIPILFPKKISFKKDCIKKYYNLIKLILPAIPVIIIKILLKLKIESITILSFILIIFSIILLFYKNKSVKDVSYTKILFINLLSLLPGISILYTFFWSIKDFNIKNKFKLAIIPYVLESLIYIRNIELSIYVMFAIIVGLVSSYGSYIFFKNKKVWKLAIYSILSALLYLFFFR